MAAICGSYGNFERFMKPTMEQLVPERKGEVMEESPELAAMKKEFLEKSEKVKAKIFEENGVRLDPHFDYLTPEIIKTLDEEDVAMLKRIRSAKTFEEFRETGRAFDKYLTDISQMEKSNTIASIFYKEFYDCAIAKLGKGLALKIFQESIREKSGGAYLPL